MYLVVLCIATRQRAVYIADGRIFSRAKTETGSNIAGSYRNHYEGGMDKKTVAVLEIIRE